MALSRIEEIQQAKARISQVLAQLQFVQGRDGGQWLRVQDGRSWTATFSPQRRTQYHYDAVRTTRIQGYRLRIEVTTSVMVRAFMVRSDITSNTLVRWIYRLKGYQTVPITHPRMAVFRMVTGDPGWVGQLLRKSAPSQALAALAEFREQAGQAASVYFQPGRLHYASPLLGADEVQASRLVKTVSNLTTLVREAESLPPPTRPARLSRMEVYAREHRFIMAAGILAGGVAVVGLATLLFILLAQWVLT